MDELDAAPPFTVGIAGRGDDADVIAVTDASDSQASAQPDAAAASSSLGQLLLDLTAQVQDERKRRSDVEQRNHVLMLELDQLQREVLDLRTAASFARGGNHHGLRRHSTTDIDTMAAAAASIHDQEDDGDGSSANGVPSPSASILCRELQEARAAKERALVEAHQRALQVLELSACVSMQHDELSALQASNSEIQAALADSEHSRGDMEREKALVQRELELMRDDVARLTREVGARGEHVATLMEKWTEAQARSEHLERQRDEAAGKISAALARGDDLARQREQLVDERDCLQHQVNHLKGAVAAKSAESRAFQAFGSHARDHLQTQNAALQRHLVLRRSVHVRASEALSEVRTLRVQLTRELRAPMLALQADCQRFLASLRAPVMSLVANADRYARVAHAEHTPLRSALNESEQARRHLHDQLWRARRDAAIVAQVVQQPADLDASTKVVSSSMEQLIRANFHSGELLMLQRSVLAGGDPGEASKARDSTLSTATTAFSRRVVCDTLYSDRSRAWSTHESVSPLIQSLVDGRNACVVTAAGASDFVVKSAASNLRETTAGGVTTTVPAIELVLTELFRYLEGSLTTSTGLRRARLSLSLLAVFNETVYDLLGLDSDPVATSIDNQQHQANHMVVVEVQALEEALLVLKGARETLDSAGERGALTPSLTHTVITVCLALEDRLVSLEASTTIRSKLQLVELAVPCDEDDNEDNTASLDRDRVRQRVAAASSIQTLCLALAGVRLASDRGHYSPSHSSFSSKGDVGAFVRFHGSKLTVLLQDTLRAGGKLLALVALPSRARVGSSAAQKAAAVLRLLEQLRQAVGCGSIGTGGSSNSERSVAMDLIGVRDRSLEMFMSRLAVHQAQNSGDGGDSNLLLSPTSATASSSSGTPLPFSSHDMREHDTRRSTLATERAGGPSLSWEAELDAMTRRYGSKTALEDLLLAIQQQQQQQQAHQLSFAPVTSPLSSPTRSLTSPSRSPSRSPSPAPKPSSSAALLLGVDLVSGQGSSLSPCGNTPGDMSDGAGESKTRRTSLSTPKSYQHRSSGIGGGRNYKAGTSSSMRKSRPRVSIGVGSASTGVSTRKSMSATTKRGKSEIVRAAGPVASSTLRSQSTMGLSASVSMGGRSRRETASSTLKKARLASAVASLHQQQRSPFR